MRYQATFIRQRQVYMLEMSIKYDHLLTGKIRNDNVDDVWVIVCSLYGTGENDVRGIDDVNFYLK